MAARADRLGTAADTDFRADALPGPTSIHVDPAGRQHVAVKDLERMGWIGVTDGKVWIVKESSSARTERFKSCDGS
jgi:hypothetical protein